MIHSTASTRLRRAGLLAAALSLLLGVLPANAASSVKLDARVLVGGRFEIGGWLALSVTLSNDGAPTDGYLSAETEGGVVRRAVELPAGARKVVSLYVEPDAFQRQVTVTYTDPNGTVTGTADIRVMEQSSDQVAIVGDPTGRLRAQLLATDQGSRPEPITLSNSEIPERPEPLDGLAAIVWAGDSASLSEAQRQSLERWLADGGRLIVLGGPDWQARTAAFDALLPVANLAAVDETSQAALAEWAGGTSGALGAATVSTGTLRDGARALVTNDDGTIVASMRDFGAGTVVFVGSDPATDEYRGWDDAPRLWGRLVPTSAAFGSFMGGFPVREEMLSSMNSALGTLPTLQVPPAELLLAVIVGYILLIGPISYIVLRRMDRREMAWITAPILVVLFSACSYGIGRTMKGSDVIVNQVAVIRTSPSGAALVETYAGIFSPDRSTYDLSVDADALLGSLPNSFDSSGNLVSGTDVVIDLGRPAHLRDLNIGSFGFGGVRASGLAEVQPALAVSWTRTDGNLVGTVTNTSAEPLADVAYISGAGGERIGDLAPGASAEFTIPSRNFNGSSASDQVYGFGGFDVQTEAQRVISLRRQVIDALVGYGGFMGVDAGAMVGRGPYLIGWRDDAGPMPIQVDGQVSRSYTAAVEVLSIRPAIGTGEVTIQPNQMGVALTAIEGDVSAFDPGQVIINDGSVTFGLTLPLEASGMQATDVEILIGPDASVAFDNTGGMMGFWPAGWTVDARDPRSGEWVRLGDLSQANRFEIDDPASVLSAGGLIEVRVTGTSDPNFGQPGVFATATVSGVIP